MSRAACAGKPARAPPENPLHIFCNFPRRDFLDLVKGVSGGSPTASGRGGAALVGKADALRAFRVHKMVLAVRKAVKLTFVYSDFNHVRVPL